MMNYKIISIANQKGGVGKTATTVNLAAALTKLNKRILVIDMDPQANVSRAFGLDVDKLDKTISEAIKGMCDINDCLVKIYENLYVIPSNLFLSGINFENTNYNSNRELFLKQLIDNIKEKFDFIFIDCPPSLAFLTLSCFVASNSIIVPIQCEFFSLQSITQILALINKVQKNFNSSLRIEGFLLTMYDAKTNLSNEVSVQIRSLFKENTYFTFIPRNISIAEGLAKGVPVIKYKPKSAGSLAYIALAKEFLEKQ